MNSKYTGQEVEAALDSASLKMNLLMRNGVFYIVSNRAITEQLCIVRQACTYKTDHRIPNSNETYLVGRNGWMGVRGSENGDVGKCELDLVFVKVYDGNYFYIVNCEGDGLKDVLERKLGRPFGIKTSHGFVKMDTYANLGIAIATPRNAISPDSVTERGSIRYFYDVRCRFAMIKKNVSGYGYRIM